MINPTHFQKVVDHVMSNDDTDLGKMRAERDYALHCLERELAIAQQAQSQLADATKLIGDLLGLELGSSERAMAFLAAVGKPKDPSGTKGYWTDGGKTWEGQ